MVTDAKESAKIVDRCVKLRFSNKSGWGKIAMFFSAIFWLQVHSLFNVGSRY